MIEVEIDGDILKGAQAVEYVCLWRFRADLVNSGKSDHQESL